MDATYRGTWRDGKPHGGFYMIEAAEITSQDYDMGKMTRNEKIAIYKVWDLIKAEKSASSPSSSSSSSRSKCFYCKGSGNCSECGVTGHHVCRRHDSNGDGHCSDCNNTGFVTCFTCHGKGHCIHCKGTGYN